MCNHHQIRESFRSHAEQIYILAKETIFFNNSHECSTFKLVINSPLTYLIHLTHCVSVWIVLSQSITENRPAPELRGLILAFNLSFLEKIYIFVCEKPKFRMAQRLCWFSLSFSLHTSVLYWTFVIDLLEFWALKKAYTRVRTIVHQHYYSNRNFKLILFRDFFFWTGSGLGSVISTTNSTL